MSIFVSFDSFDIGYFVQPCNIPCSIQHVVSAPSTYPGSCKTCLSRKPVFGRKISLIFPIIYQIVDQNIALWSLPTGAWMPELSSFNWFGRKNEQFSQFAHRFHWDKTCLYFELLSTLSTYKLHWNYSISWSVMPKQVFLMTVQEAHKEYNSLTDQIRSKYELLDSGECGSVGTPAFNAECSELAHLMARMSKLCKHLNLPMPKELHRPPHFKHWSALNSKFICGRFN